MELKKLSRNLSVDATMLYDLLSKFDYETIKEYFDTVYGKEDNKCFDFEYGLLVGTIENYGGRPRLVDLQFTQRHLI